MDKKKLQLTSEVVIVAIIGVATFFVAGYFDLLELFIEFSHDHEDWELDEILITSMVLALCLAVVLAKRTKQLDLEVARRKKAEDRLDKLARTDPLTKLPNRRDFFPRFEESVRLASLENTSQAVLFIDIDNFKQVNDEHGHATGDALLIAVASVLMSTVRKTDLVSRVAGDEFAVVLSSIENQDEAVIVAEKILEKCTEAHQLGISLSIGIALMPKDAASAQELLAVADKAMYTAKQRGKNQYYTFSE